ncbi:hypothetical protein DRQ09_04505 [candidate division KSB1 bacterium]|nr:MAG: hypothetical protein DRQ09_04505 [candidate division KSB1 bacterium]
MSCKSPDNSKGLYLIKEYYSMIRFIKVVIIIMILTVEIFPKSVKPQSKQNGVYISYQIGHLSLIDELISNQQYCGSLSGWEIKWIAGDSSQITQLGFNYILGKRIKNFSVEAEVQNFTLYYDWLLKSDIFRIFSKECTFYSGPSVLIFLHTRRQDIGNTPLEKSNLGSISINIYNRIAFRITPAFCLMSDFRLSLFSFTGKTVDTVPGEQEPSNLKVLSGFSAVDLYSIVSFRWFLQKYFSLTFEYFFNLKQVSVWDYYRSLTDNISLKLGIWF